MRDYTKFFTPDETADYLVSLAQIENHMTILEPSAGNGQICKAIRKLKHSNVTIDAVEVNPEHTVHLSMYANIVYIDNFLKRVNNKNCYDRIIANPPFGNGTKAGNHIIEMIKCLKPQGILVSIVPQEEQWYFKYIAGGSHITPIKNWSRNSDGSITDLCVLKYFKPA